MTIADCAQTFFDRRRERRIAELREELRHVTDRFHRRLLEKELGAAMAARADERARAMSIVRNLEGQRHA